MVNPLKVVSKSYRLYKLLQGKNYVQEHKHHKAVMRAMPLKEIIVEHPSFPGIPFSPLHQFQNWDGQIVVQNINIFQPVNAQQCVELANGAAALGYTLRPFGQMHGWSPLAVNGNKAKDDPEKIFFVDTINLNSKQFKVVNGTPMATFEVGVTIEQATTFLEEQTAYGQPNGYSFVNMTAPGQMSIGGVLAIGGHGTSIASQSNSGDFCGCLSNLIRSFKAIVFENGEYREKYFERSHPDAAAFLVHLGRAFITQVTMQPVPNYYLEVRNWYPKASTLYEPVKPKQSPLSLQALAEKYGRLEVIQFPFTGNPWVKTWQQVPGLTVHPKFTPYNNKFANIISADASKFIQNLFNEEPEYTPWLMKAFLFFGRYLSTSGRSCYAMSGLSKNLLIYVQNSTLRITALGYIMQIKRSDIQATAILYMNEYNRLLKKYQKDNKFPINAPVEIRITGIDDPALLNIPGAEPPLLAASAPMHPDRKELDTVFWVDILTMPETPYVAEFYTEMEAFMYKTWPDNLRPEWSKGWAFNDKGGWQNLHVLHKVIPQYYAATLPRAKQILEKYDPKNVYTNWLINQIFK